MPEDLKSLSLWWCGPHWLKEDEIRWPQFNLKTTPKDLPERRQTVSINLNRVMATWDLFDRFSSFSRLVRIVAFLRRFIRNSKIKNSRSRAIELPGRESRQKTDLLTVEELEESRIRLIKIVQAQFFEADIKTILVKGRVERSSKILSLNPFLDTNGILRVGGRLKHASIPYESKHPALLPGKHAFTILIIVH